jgi:DNA-binding SARP family transcriptional activator/tetratricopeptide (TPR) repeat protein
MALKIYLLGQFNIEVGDQMLELPSRPAQSLLAYLALNPGLAHRREKLAGMLWPDATEVNARSYLRQALWRTRKALESETSTWEQYLLINDFSVKFDDESDYWLDVNALLEVGEATPIVEIETAVALYKGELLPGFYDEWVLLERDRLQAAYHQRMKLLLDSLLAHGEWHEALKWGEQWIRLGHAPEAAYQSLMVVYDGLGDQGMIRYTYQRCMETMERELGLEPSPETERLYEQLRQEKATPASVSPPRVPGHMPASPAFLEDKRSLVSERPLFVAREPELAKLDGYLDLALAGQSRVVFVTGEAGSGKTALIREFAQFAQDSHHDLIVAGGNCNAHTGIGDPYLPFREILELLTGDVEAHWAAGAITRDHALRLWNLLPLTGEALAESGLELLDTFVPGQPLIRRISASTSANEEWATRLADFIKGSKEDSSAAAQQQRDLFEQYTRVLQILSRQVPLVLVVDDLQWADLGSISLLFHLGRLLAGSRILVLGAYRSEEIALGREGKQHPLESVVNELQRLFGDILVNMDEAERRDFVQAVLNSEANLLGNSFRQMLFQQTGGHPLFTIELLRGMQERGDLLQDSEGRWIEGPELDWHTLPARVEAVIAQRIGRLPQSLRSALLAASVEGELFTAEVVARLQGVDQHRMVELLSRELDKRHRLVHSQSILRMDGRLLSRYRFRHIQIQRYLYDSLDDVERVHLHEQAGMILEELYGSEEQKAAVAVQLARHFQEAGITEKAIHYLHQAGRRAMQLSAYKEASEHLGNGLALLETLPDTPERAQQELALQMDLGMTWLSMGIPATVMETAYSRARDLCLQTGKTDQLCSAIGGLAILNYVRGRHRRGLAFAEEALDLARQANDPVLLVLGHWVQGLILFGLGEYLASQEHLGQAIAIYDPQEHHDALVRIRGVDGGASAFAYEACCLWTLGYVDQAMRRREEAIALARELGHAFTLEDVLCYGGGFIDAMRRDGPSLKSHADEMIYLANNKGFPGWLKMSTCLRGEALTMVGREEEGIELMRSSLAGRIAMGERVNSPEILRAQAETYSRLGRIEEAQNTLAEAFAWLEESDERHWQAELLRAKGDLLLHQGDEDGARISYEEAIESARIRQARSWELRSTISLARLLQKQGNPEKAKQILEPIYNWFPEGLDMPDLEEAGILLDELVDSLPDR